MSHQNTTFNQILQLIPRHVFEKCVSQHRGNFASKGFSCWSQFTAMLFGQFSGQSGLRGIETGLQTNQTSLYHLGIKPIKKSTLAYANENRSCKIYEDLFYQLLGWFPGMKKKHKFRFKNPLYSIDASTIDLCLSMFPWAHFRKAKGGIKLHVKIDHSGYIPDFVSITDAKVHERNEIEKMPMKKGDVIVFDRGYTDYKNYASYCDKGIYFVTRIKKNAHFKVLEEHEVSSYEHIGFDRTIKMAGYYKSKDCPHKLRIVESFDPETGKEVVLLTNNFLWSPRTISAIYKDRWQIEIFFKTIKQNLKIKSFYGTSENAVMAQIWIAMIAFLLLKYLSSLSTIDWTVGALMAVIPVLLFIRQDLWIWLNKLKPDIPIMNKNKEQMGLELW